MGITYADILDQILFVKRKFDLKALVNFASVFYFSALVMDGESLFFCAVPLEMMDLVLPSVTKTLTGNTASLYMSVALAK